MSIIKIGNKIIHEEFRKYYVTGVIAVFGKADIIIPHQKYCKNCNGLGTTPFFFATAGPFEYQPQDKNNIEYTTHPENHKWYQGKWAEFDCPVCNASGIDPDYRPGPYVTSPMKPGIFKPMPQMIKQTDPIEDYTDV